MKKIRQQCQAREDFAYWERIRNVRMKELGDGLEQAKDELQQAQGELAKALARIAELENR